MKKYDFVKKMNKQQFNNSELKTKKKKFVNQCIHIPNSRSRKHGVRLLTGNKFYDRNLSVIVECSEPGVWSGEIWGSAALTWFSNCSFLYSFHLFCRGLFNNSVLFMKGPASNFLTSQVSLILVFFWCSSSL